MIMIKIEKQNDNYFTSELNGDAKTVKEEFVIGLYDFMKSLSETGISDDRIEIVINTIANESLTRFKLSTLTEDII